MQNVRDHCEYIFFSCSARQNDISMTCVCECHAQKGASAINQTTATLLPKTTPTTNDSNQTPNLACIVNQPAPPTGTHLAQPTQLKPHPTPTMGLSSNQPIGGTTNLQAVGNPPKSLLPSMLVSASSSNSVQSDSQSKASNKKSIVDLLSSSCKSNETKKLSVAKTVSEDSNKEAEKSKTSNVICCSELENCPSNKPSDAVEKMKASGSCAGACSSAQSSESRKVCESDGVAAEPTTALVKEEGEKMGGGAEKEKEKEVIVLDDDFKPPKKRFRTPAAASSDGPVSSLL